MSQPDRSPFEPPTSAPPADRLELERFAWRWRALLGVLSLQLLLGVIAAAAKGLDLPLLALWLVLNVAPPAVALWLLWRRNPAALGVCLLSVAPLAGLSSGDESSLVRTMVKPLLFTSLALTISLMWSLGMFIRGNRIR